MFLGICSLLLGNSAAMVTIAVIGRFMITFALNTMLQISSEILPTQLRYTTSRIKLSADDFKYHNQGSGCSYYGGDVADF